MKRTQTSNVNYHSKIVATIAVDMDIALLNAEKTTG